MTHRLGTSGRSSPWLFLAFGLFSLGAIGWITALQSNLFIDYDPPGADIKNDWVVAKALVSGDNPYADLAQLADRYAAGEYVPPDAAAGSGELRTPRTPGAVILAIPWLAFPISEIAEWNNLTSLFLMVFGLAVIVWKRAGPIWVFASLGILISTPMIWDLKHSNVSSLMAVLIVWFIYRIETGDSVSGGIALGLAATLKIFPGVLFIVAIVHKRWRALVSGTVTIAILNFVPLALPEVHATDMFDALVGATERFGGFNNNISFGHLIESSVGFAAYVVIVAAVIGGAWLWTARKPGSVLADALLLLCLATILTPISWAHYALGALPVALGLAVAPDTAVPTRVLILFGFIAMAPTTHTSLTTAGICLFALAAALQRLIGSRGVAPVIEASTPAPGV